ncbi:hypothetical protein PPN31114_03147 [Pandoraea pneumonica]|jgi:hypothetical protein|uniref:Uncharacterized protein n=1 Tax=Pandoraea pneumonica TaxID=2508299 RepID=A0A5E4WD15_9BURK|nr:hypothetical protein [Pandoraea pneumonica]VVE21266.1 hypothetical protein PPN31114_03147 [Pandoraea pneumonica]
MTRKIALAAFLAIPGSFAILAIALLHPTLRRELARAAGLEPVFANLSRQLVLFALVCHLHLHHRQGMRICTQGADCDAFAR